ncbi:uncharacterized protein LOC131931145 isoform X2 [Physella acuta]|uniref:uncharacterized protein LOC131931145 isoform X2 n=1 Tax=Physella acuta TaxID=109671 RepID=UPI0027DB785F|nr:uncharacterized protein LOC131931145 isoform X2 [Physella acuta]
MVAMSKAKCNKPDFVVNLQAYFVTIATILGTGILGLPVKLTQAGFYPFLISFLTDAVVQSLLIYFFTDVLQRAMAAQYQRKGEESIPLNTVIEEEFCIDSDDDDDDGQSNGAIMRGKMQHIREVPLVQSPNLHMLGKLFLTCGLQQTFDVLIILQFIALLISYALAGSEAYAQLIGIEHIYVIPVFVWVLTLVILFGLQLIQPVISILTFLKGSLLLGTAGVTFYVGLQVARTISNDFSYLGAPFLMGTVALGGVCNIMPYTFEKVTFKKKQIFNYRLAVLLGLWTCVFLNILWCLAVLEIVPQTIVMACMPQVVKGQMFSNTTSGHSAPSICRGDLSLESAEMKGEISTLPLTKLLQRDHPSLAWVAILVEIFIMVSITVSYLTVGSVLHHTLSGMVKSFFMKQHITSHRSKKQKQLPKEWLAKTGLSFLAFVVVFVVAILDPQGFIDILEKLVSFSLNAEVGIFIFLMFLWSRRQNYQDLEIPLPMSKCSEYLIFIIPLFFNFAVFYDVYSTISEIYNPKSHSMVWINSTNWSELTGVNGTTYGNISLNNLTPTLLSNATQ